MGLQEDSARQRQLAEEAFFNQHGYLPAPPQLPPRKPDFLVDVVGGLAEMALKMMVVGFIVWVLAALMWGVVAGVMGDRDVTEAEAYVLLFITFVVLPVGVYTMLFRPGGLRKASHDFQTVARNFQAGLREAKAEQYRDGEWERLERETLAKRAKIEAKLDAKKAAKDAPKAGKDDR